MGGTGQDDGRTAVLAAFRKQVGWCNGLGAPFTAEVVTVLAEDVARDGPVARLVRNWPGDPVADALPLRFAAALHVLVLNGQVPDLAACYPHHAEPELDPERLRIVVADVLARFGDHLRSFIASPPQTNEVGRSAVLLGGFLQVAATTGLPLRLLEIGASAGLNLLWDRYRYRLGSAAWGDPASPVLLAPEWEGPLPPLSAPLRVAERTGCDVAPVDLHRNEACLRLRSYVWPDHAERLARLDAAIALAREVGVQVERTDAGTWVQEHLAAPAPGRATVLYHSIMWQYMPEPTRAAVRDAIDQAGTRATEQAPLAWLRFEPPGSEGGPELHLTLWPGFRRHRLAVARPHGTAVTWSGLEDGRRASA